MSRDEAEKGFSKFKTNSSSCDLLFTTTIVAVYSFLAARYFSFANKA
jgi:hypothetical protein